MIRGKIYHPKLQDLFGPIPLVYGKSPWYYSTKDHKYYDKVTGKEIRLKKMSLNQFLELNLEQLAKKRKSSL